jgi:polysaccharide export outer membrane protein
MQRKTSMSEIVFFGADEPRATAVPTRARRARSRGFRFALPALACLGALVLAQAPAYAQRGNAGAAGNARPTPAAPQVDNDVQGYQVQPGDLLHVSVWKEEGLDLDVLVRPDGGFSFPLAGDVAAAGKTVEQLRQEITQRLQRYIPGLVVTVAVKEINGNKIYVIGQVNKSGEFVVNPRVDVMQALSIAGGMTAFAAAGDIFVLRRENGRQVALPFSYNDVVRGKNLDQNILLQSGDVVVVP